MYMEFVAKFTEFFMFTKKKKVKATQDLEVGLVADKKCCTGSNCCENLEQAVRDLAYLKWEAAGCPEGDGVVFWLEAEQELSK